MAKTKDEKINTAERYATSLFYAPQQEPTSRNYNAHGQAPGTSMPTNGAARPISKIQPSGQSQRQDAARQDQVAFSCELNDARNGSHHDDDAFRRPASSGNANARIVNSQPRNASGPVYSGEFLSNLDALLNG